MARLETRLTKTEWKEVREWLWNHREYSKYGLLKEAVLEKVRRKETLAAERSQSEELLASSVQLTEPHR